MAQSVVESMPCDGSVAGLDSQSSLHVHVCLEGRERETERERDRERERERIQVPTQAVEVRLLRLMLIMVSAPSNQSYMYLIPSSEPPLRLLSRVRPDYRSLCRIAIWQDRSLFETNFGRRRDPTSFRTEHELKTIARGRRFIVGLAQ